jgi:Amt family ammonium transporter
MYANIYSKQITGRSMKMKSSGLFMFLLPILTFANEKIDSGDTAWMLMATALVMLMTPAGLALFYGGMTRSKNVLNTMGMSLMAYAVGTLVWV